VSAERRAVSGAELFARYAYPPNELGYCGPGEPAALLEAAVEGGQESLLAATESPTRSILAWWRRTGSATT